MKAKKYMLFELLCDILEKEKLETADNYLVAWDHG